MSDSDEEWFVPAKRQKPDRWYVPANRQKHDSDAPVATSSAQSECTELCAPRMDTVYGTVLERTPLQSDELCQHMRGVKQEILFTSRYPTSPSMGSGLYEISWSIVCSLARSTGWLRVVDNGDEKVDTDVCGAGSKSDLGSVLGDVVHNRWYL